MLLPGVVAAPKCPGGFVPLEACWGLQNGLKWSSSECLIFLSAVSMQVSPGSWSGEKLQHRLFPSWIGLFPGGGEQGAMLLPKCWHRGSCWALGPRGVPSAVLPPPRPSGNPHHRPCTAPRSAGEHEEHPQPRNPPDFRLMEKKKSFHLPEIILSAALNQSTISWSFCSSSRILMSFHCKCC